MASDWAEEQAMKDAWCFNSQKCFIMWPSNYSCMGSCTTLQEELVFSPLITWIKKNNAVIFKCIVLNIIVFEKKISLIIFVLLTVCHTQTLSWNNTLCVILGCILISIWYFEYLYRCLGKTMSHMQNKLAKDHLNHYTPLPQKQLQKCTSGAQSNILVPVLL